MFEIGLSLRVQGETGRCAARQAAGGAGEEPPRSNLEEGPKTLDGEIEELGATLSAMRFSMA